MIGTKRARIVAATAGVLVALATASSASAELGVTTFEGGAFDLGGNPVTTAGSHPQNVSATFRLTEELAADGFEYATEDLKDVEVDLPPGLVGSVHEFETCSETNLAAGGSNIPQCPIGSQVGFIIVHKNGNQGVPGEAKPGYLPVFNLPPPAGKAALFGFNATGAIFHFSAQLRRDPGVPGGYRVRFSSLNAPQTLPLAGATVTIWGVPGDSDNDDQRGWVADNGFGISCARFGAPDCSFPSPEAADPKPLISLPTSCEEPARTDITVTGYLGDSASSSFTNPNEDCAALEFAPTLQAQPTTEAADSPTGLEVDLHVPQHNGAEETVTAHLRDTTVTLPKGLTINPSGANGLDACTPAQIDLEGEGPAQCPDESRIGSVEVLTPLLDHPVLGSVYIAKPFDNPFDSLLAIYIAVNDPVSGTVAKLAGEVHADPETGQLTTTVSDNPQVPFEHFKLKFFEGDHASLRTPPTCGSYETVSTLTPWSAPETGPPVTDSDSFVITQAAHGGTCASSADSMPHSPLFSGGTLTSQASAYSSFVVSLRREDGSQEFSALTLTPPPGLVAKLIGTPYCPDASLAAAASRSGRDEAASPSCPLASQVGSVSVGAGAGPSPYYAEGKAYLAGPYNGAPLSLAIVTPATAGPFDLGTVVVRTALYVDPETARITAKSDPIPRILKGIPLDVRSIQVRLDKPEFTLNPTNCNPLAVAGQMLSALGRIAELQSPFQVGGCGALGFKPKLKLRLKGGTKRSANPALRAVLTMPPGGANISRVSVALPRSEFLEQSHIRTVCTRVQFAANQCPRAAVYGFARAFTPLLEQPLEGPVYLRSSDNPLPDLVADLNGQIRIALRGRIDSFRGGIRTTFEGVPDAPVSRFVLRMQGGKKGLLVNSRNICLSANRATVEFDGQNGKIADLRPVLKTKCGKKARKHGKRRR